MRYEVITNKDGYVQIIHHTNSPRDTYELDLTKYDLTGLRLYAYKVGKDRLIFDEEEYQRLLDSKQKIIDGKEIIELKQKLTDSDYIVSRAFEEVMQLTNPLTWVTDCLKITLKYAKKYKETIELRANYRKRIEELEK